MLARREFREKRGIASSIFILHFEEDASLILHSVSSPIALKQVATRAGIALRTLKILTGGSPILAHRLPPRLFASILSEQHRGRD